MTYLEFQETELTMSETRSQLMVWPGLVEKEVLSPSSCREVTACWRALSSWLVSL